MFISGAFALDNYIFSIKLFVLMFLFFQTSANAFVPWYNIKLIIKVEMEYKNG